MLQRALVLLRTLDSPELGYDCEKDNGTGTKLVLVLPGRNNVVIDVAPVELIDADSGGMVDERIVVMIGQYRRGVL